MEDTFVCSCGATVTRRNVLILTQHVISPEHEAGMLARGLVQHRHSERWVTPNGRPVDVGAEGARPYRTVNCVACVVDATAEAEFTHDSELPSELCPYVDCEDHRGQDRESYGDTQDRESYAVQP